MTPFLNLTMYRRPEEDENDTDGPYLINPEQIVTIKRNSDYVTCIVLTTGGFIQVEEGISEILDMLDNRTGVRPTQRAA